jgi:hypothetical protein
MITSSPKPLVRHVTDERQPGQPYRSLDQAVQAELDEHGAPDEVHYSSVAIGQVVRYSALLIWRSVRTDLTDEQREAVERWGDVLSRHDV